MRFWSLIPLLLVVSACSRGPFAPSDLTMEQVGGQYHICALEFVPDGEFPPPLDIRAAEIDLEADQAPRLFVSRQMPQFELTYTPTDDDLPRRLGREYELRRSTVTLNFESTPRELGRLLLPASLELDFTPGTRTLRISEAHSRHSVRRSDYERMSGEGHPNVADPITGRLSGTFQVGGCD